jgi:hypothetical protein
VACSTQQRVHQLSQGGWGWGGGGAARRHSGGKDGGINNTTGRGRGSSIQELFLEQKLENYFSKRPRKKDGDTDGGV